MTKILAIDVHYGDEIAVAAGVLFSAWDAQTAELEKTCDVPVDSDYIPGQFYLRELPCIFALLDEFESMPDMIVVDGYVQLGAEQKAGLGQHLWQELNKSVPIIGVAKSKFQGAPDETRLLRGKSETPLYVTSAGLELETAKSYIASMAGPYRIPTLLKQVDQLCRARLESLG
ncbi:MAG: endonuclease V [Anaerolineae bacterium]